MTYEELLTVIAKAEQEKTTALDLSYKEIAVLPPQIGKLSALTELSLSGNELTALPPEIGRLTALSRLDLSHNGLRTLPPEIGRLTALASLDLRYNRLTTLPPEIGRLTALTELRLGSYGWAQNGIAAPAGNQLTALPPEIGRLTALTGLDLSGNLLKSLPPEIGRLTALTALSLNDNELTALPAELGLLTALINLDVRGNYLVSPPPEICKSGTKAILAFLRARLKHGTMRQWLSKMVVVGEGGVGKTSLVNMLSGRPFNDQEETTHGLRPHKPIEVPHPAEPGVTMKLFVWDFGGQQIYHATHQFFLTNKAVFVLVWNARLDYNQGRLEYWLDTIRARAPESPILIVATHLDQRPAVSPPLKEWKEKYRIAGSFEVSNKTGQGTAELKAEIARVAAALPLMGVECPRGWVAAADKGIQGVQRYHSDPAGSRPYMPADELRDIVRKQGVDEDEIEPMLQWFHELGGILYFPADPELRDMVVLSPWQVNADISKVLDHSNPQLDSGIFTYDHQNEVWHTLDPKIRQHLVRLMERFDLSYRIPETSSSLVVARLPADPPDDWERRWDALRGTAVCREVRLHWLLNTVPAGIPSWFLARTHRFSINVQWRLGGLFADEGGKHLGLIRVQPHQRRIELAVRGPYPHNFFALLKDGLEVTLARYPGLEIKRLIPCPCGKTQPCGFQFDYANLLKRLEAGKTDVECGESFTRISITKLLSGWSAGQETLGEELLHALRSEIKEGFDGQKNAHAEMLALFQRQFLALLRAVQGQEESHCPNVFVLRPMSQAFFSRPFGQNLELQLLCQEPGRWHPTGTDGRYTFKKPMVWFVTVVPYLKRLVQVLRCTTPVAGMLGDADFWQDFSRQVDFMDGLLQQVPERPDLAADDAPARIEGAALRALRKLLDELDPKQSWGGLQKVLTPEGHYLWLCSRHAAGYAR